MIVFDVSSLVGAAIRRDGTPERALRHALQADTLALSRAVAEELLDVFHRPRLARYLDAVLGAEVLGSVLSAAVWFDPAVRVLDCRDAKDNKYLELALAAGAGTVVSSDDDLLVLHPSPFGRSVCEAAGGAATGGARRARPAPGRVPGRERPGRPVGESAPPAEHEGPSGSPRGPRAPMLSPPRRPAMDDVVEVTIPVEAHAAAALADAGTREMVGRLVSRVLERRRRKAARLFDVMDRFAAEARQAGLTDEIVAQELAAYNAERRG